MTKLSTSNPKWTLELSIRQRIEKYSDKEIKDYLKQIPWALQFIENPKEEWIRYAIKQHYSAIQHVKNVTVEHQRLAIKCNINAIEYIENLDEELAIELLTDDPLIIKQIRNPTDIMKSVAKILK